MISPKLATLNLKTIDLQSKEIIPLKICLTAQETCAEDRESIVREKIGNYVGVFAKHGLLVEYTLKRMPILFANMTEFDGSSQGSVWISGTFYNPKTDTVLVGAKFIEMQTDKPAFFRYKGTKVAIPQNQLSEREIKRLIKDSFYTIQCINMIPQLGRDSCTMIAKLFKLVDIPLVCRYLKYVGVPEIEIKVSLSDAEADRPYTNSKVDELTEFYDHFSEKTRINFDQLYKKLVNPYELLYASRSYKPTDLSYTDLYSKYPYEIKEPVSRAYFKVLELVHFFKLIESPKTCLTLGDAPGGFAQCLTQMFPDTFVSTVSLLDKDAIQYSQTIKKNDRIKIDGLKDGRGDLLNVENIRYLNDTYKGVDFVGCDGALGYEDKELDHIPLLFAEIVAAMGSLRTGGSAVFKLYRIWGRLTLDMYLLLLKYFEFAYFYKCRSSRIASLETFFIAKGFKGIEANEHKGLLDILPSLLKKEVSSITNYTIPDQLRTEICDFNTYYDDIVLFHHRLILEYHNYEGNVIDREPFYQYQMDYAENFFKKSI